MSDICLDCSPIDHVGHRHYDRVNLLGAQDCGEDAESV